MPLSVLAVLVVIPFGWMLLASVKTSNEVFSIPMKLLPTRIPVGELPPDHLG